MSAVLKYRVPGNKIISKKGAFMPLSSLGDYQGFIVSDFLFGKVYGFQEGQSEKYSSIKSQKPHVGSEEEYSRRGGDVLKQLKSGAAEKIVLSRVRSIEHSPAKEKLFIDLCDAYPNAMVYWIESRYFGTWIGATPEVLIDRNKDHVKMVALAGTKTADDHSSWTNKELEEQALVASYLKDKLNQFGSLQISATSEREAGPVKHLITEFTLSDPPCDEELIRLIHPTPAVAGVPQRKAIELIDSIEKHDRELYAGVIGITNDRSKLFVNLRCMQIISGVCYLYLGGGYTKDSIVAMEWSETENKAKTLLNILKKH